MVSTSVGWFWLFFGENQQFQFFITKCENRFGSCLLSFLETLNVLIKFAYERDVFICDFVPVVKICQTDLFSMCSDATINYRQKHFQIMCDFVSNSFVTITQHWYRHPCILQDWSFLSNSHFQCSSLIPIDPNSMKMALSSYTKEGHVVKALLYLGAQALPLVPKA